MPKSNLEIQSHPPEENTEKRHKSCSQTPWVTCVNKHQDLEKKHEHLQKFQAAIIAEFGRNLRICPCNPPQN